MPIANHSTNVRAKPTGLGQPNRGEACEDGSNAARPRTDVGEQESLLTGRRECGKSLAEKRADSTWLGKATGRDSVNAMISMSTDFLVGTGKSWEMETTPISTPQTFSTPNSQPLRLPSVRCLTVSSHDVCPSAVVPQSSFENAMSMPELVTRCVVWDNPPR